MFNLNGKKALVTGSSQGIGKAIAACLAENGCEVWVQASKSLEKAQGVVDEITAKGGCAHACAADLARLDAAQKLYAQTGDADILILNASVQIRKPWQEITPEDFDLQITVNLKQTLLLIQRYAPHMLQQHWGRIVTVGSIQQAKPHKDMLVYAASKDAQFNLVRNLAKQISGGGVTINNMAPGTIVTPRNSAVLEDAAYRAACEQAVPCGRLGKPEDCAAAVLLLCAEEGGYITGENIYCDGGMHL